MNAILIGSFIAVVGLIAAATFRAPRLTSVLLWSLIATIFCSAALLLTLPGPFSEKALWMTVIVPLMWAVFQFWCYWDASKWRVAAGLISLSFIGGVVVLLTEPLV